jgi:phosphoribosyl 1,2-cyclic phosphodiesterase
MDKIKFLGTAGARFVVMRQLRKSGGIWITLDGTNILVDPGPGSLVRCLSSKPRLNPLDLDGILLSHCHIDHSNDVNIMIEAMTNGGWKKKGVVFAPREALENDPVVLNYVRKYLDDVVVIKEKGSYKIGNISFSTPVKHIHHGVEGYGFNIFGKDCSISIITDTDYFKDLEFFYKGDILILNTMMLEDYEAKDVEHLCMEDAERIISANKPKLAVLTHFGMSMIKAKPWVVAEGLSKKLGIDVVAASDGMQIDLDKYK